MRNVRLSLKNSIHHVMNRGDKGEKIFYLPKYKKYFINLIKEYAEKIGIEIIAYVVMENHYHIILKNSSNNLSRFMMLINMKYAIYYRENEGGKGYVFQNRFKSTLIENAEYLKKCIIYLYLNPLRKGLTIDPFEYKWSSLFEIASKTNTDAAFRNLIDLFGSISNFESSVKQMKGEVLKVKKFKNITYLGSEQDILNSIDNFNRRKLNLNEIHPKRRSDDKLPVSLEIVYEDIMNTFKVDLKHSTRASVDTETTHKILFFIRDKYMIPFVTINKIKLFHKYSQYSLSNIFNRYKASKKGKI